MALAVQETVWIPMPDGIRLAATVWMPEGEGPFPAVLEFLPYRRRDGTAMRDDSTYPHYAAQGIAGVRVDSRGNGDSEGFFDDEYSPQELDDACQVIEWIAAQDWSNGSVGMMGISWGGFNSLQVAALRPSALKGVISIASTADRYNDDIHYKGGCLLSANVSWAGTMMNYCSRAPDPEVVGNGWAEIWRERLEKQPFLLETWLRHQRRDAYWRHGSICEDWRAIRCPVWAIAGWADGYRNTPSTIAANLHADVTAMTGPWVHKYPHFAWPEPRIDFLGMSVDWWKQTLCSEARGIEEWPQYRAYRIEAGQPSSWRARDAGKWLGTDWPMRRGQMALSLGPQGRLGTERGPPVTFSTPQHCGMMAGEYFTLAPDADMPADQRADDALSECWESRASEDAVDILGRPSLRATVSVDQPQGNLIARLVDVHPDGTSTLIARGVLNLCHRDGNAEPKAVEPGAPVAVTLMLDETCYRVLPGHRLRLALSTAYFPLVLPSPAPVKMTLTDGKLRLPLAGDAVEFDVPEPSDPDPLPKYPQKAAGNRQRGWIHDLGNGRVRYALLEDTGLIEHPRNAMQWREVRDEVWQIDPTDPLSATGELRFRQLRRRGAWETSAETRISFSCTVSTWNVSADLVAREGETEFLRRDWSFSVPRDHM